MKTPQQLDECAICEAAIIGEDDGVITRTDRVLCKHCVKDILELARQAYRPLLARLRNLEKAHDPE